MGKLIKAEENKLYCDINLEESGLTLTDKDGTRLDNIRLVFENDELTGFYEPNLDRVLE